jgi:hypothetical protein
MSRKSLAIGCAAGFGGDRTDAAGPVVDTLIARKDPGILIFEVLAERTLALAQLDRQQNPNRGYAPLMEPMLRPVLWKCLHHNISIVSNFGAANSRAAARRIQQMAAEEGFSQVRIAVVEGDDLSDERERELLQKWIAPNDTHRPIVSANAYLGATSIADALRAGAQIVITGRVADPSLVVGPAMAHFNWSESDWDVLARATIAGHLIECGAQVTGGYFADPGFKEVADLDNVGFPIIEMEEDGSFIVGKARGTGGVVNCQTVKEQLLYEIHDPAAYITPDVVADISEVEAKEIGLNRVAIHGIRGYPRPELLKVIVFFPGGWLGEGEISYAGPNAEARAQLAADIIRRRLNDELKIRYDLIGILSVFGDDGGHANTRRLPGNARDVRLRIAGVHQERERIEALVREVIALYTCGPAGGGGIRTAITPRLHSASCFVPRELVSTTFTFLD